MTLEETNRLRERMGIAPSTELPTDKKEDNVNPPIIKTPEDSNTTKNEVVEEQPQGKAPEKTKEKPKAKETPQPTAELTTEQLIEALKKRGMDISSLDDLSPKKESAEEIATKREQAKMAYAFTKGLITPKQYQSFAADSNDLSNLVYRQYLAEQKKEDSALMDSEILEEFQEKYSLNDDPTSRKFKRGQREIAALGNTILKETYKEFYELDDNYSKYETGENTRKAEEKKLIEETPKYKAHIDNIFSNDLKTVSLKIEGTDYEVEVSDEMLAEAKSQFLDTETAISHIKDGFNKDAVSEIARASVILKNLDSIVESAAKKYLFNHEAGLKGVVVVGQAKKADPARELTDQEKKLREIYKIPQGVN